MFSRHRDRMLEIMRDSRLGTHGGLALIFVVLAKILMLGLALRNRTSSLAAACGQPRDCRIIDVSSSLCAGKGLAMCSLAKLMGDKPASHSAGRLFFAAVLLRVCMVWLLWW
ncbi:adenosylcobinamide-GDP ribazoletransferase [Shigella flexneri]